MTRHLVCEGACNPLCLAIDTRVREYRVEHHVTDGGGARFGKLLPIPAYLAADLRTLQHTPHEIINDERAQCEKCGYLRRHGRIQASVGAFA